MLSCGPGRRLSCVSGPVPAASSASIRMASNSARRSIGAPVEPIISPTLLGPASLAIQLAARQRGSSSSSGRERQDTAAVCLRDRRTVTPRQVRRPPRLDMDRRDRRWRPSLRASAAPVRSARARRVVDIVGSSTRRPACPLTLSTAQYTNPWLRELDPLCAFHHDLKTRLGYAPVGTAAPIATMHRATICPSAAQVVMHPNVGLDVDGDTVFGGAHHRHQGSGDVHRS